MPGARSPELMDLTSPECRPELGGAAPVLPAPAPCLSSPCPPPKAGSRRQAWAFTNTTVLDPHSNFIRRSFLKPSPHFAGGKSDAQRSLITFLKSHSQEAVELPSPASGWRAGSRMPGQRPCAAQPWDGALQRRGSGRGAGPGDCLAPSPWPPLFHAFFCWPSVCRPWARGAAPVSSALLHFPSHVLLSHVYFLRAHSKEFASQSRWRSQVPRAGRTEGGARAFPTPGPMCGWSARAGPARVGTGGASSLWPRAWPRVGGAVCVHADVWAPSEARW